MFMLALALAPVLIDPAHCRQQSGGASRWQTDGQGTLTVSTEDRFAGEVVLRCRVRFALPVKAVTVEFERARIAFRPAAAEGGRSGLTIAVAGESTELVQVSREDWIEASNRSWRIEFAEPRKDVDVVVKAIDDSATGSVRIDLRRLRLAP